MRIRSSLSLKILGWLFLNFFLLLVGFLFLFNAQYHFDWKWMFLNSARPRVETLRNLIEGELNTIEPEAWKNAMDRYSKAYRIRFSLWDENGNPLTEVPEEPLPELVRIRMLLHQLSLQPTPAIEKALPPEVQLQQGGGGSKRFPVLLRSNNPVRYWLLMGIRLNNPSFPDKPRHLVLMGKAKSLGMGGLIVDLASWIRIFVGTFVLSLLFWFPLLRRMNRSIGELTDATQLIAEGHFDTRVSDERKDELGLLAKSINQMGARLEDFTIGQKRFLGDVAHELCSPLARLQMALGIIEERADNPVKVYVKSAMDTSDQIAKLVNELLSFSKSFFGSTLIKRESILVMEAVHEAIRFEGLETSFFTLDVPVELRVLADLEILTRVFANLIRNAIRHGARPIRISAFIKEGVVGILVADSGNGVSEEDLPKIFDAFYRVDPSRTRHTGGTGLGLALVKTGIESCGGTVSARNLQPHGLVVRIQLSSS